MWEDARVTLRALSVFLAISALCAGCTGTVEGDLAGLDSSTPDAAIAPGGDAGPAWADAALPAGPDAATAGPDAGPPDAAFQGTLPAGDGTETLDVAGQQRTVLLYAPAAVATRALPLVIALHGNGDTAANFVAALGLRALADADGFVLAAPQGITQSFTVYGQPVDGVDWDAYRTTADGNIDLPLLGALLDRLWATGSIDEKRSLVFGYSQGGYLSFRWGLEASASLSCATVAAAGNPMPGSTLISGAARKVAVALQVGSLDGAVNNARSSRDALQAAGHPVSYAEIAGAGHVPFPGDPKVPLEWCLSQSLP